jgi:hypothetical protein
LGGELLLDIEQEVLLLGRRQKVPFLVEVTEDHILVKVGEENFMEGFRRTTS